MEYQFRKCTLEDFEFLYNLKKENFKWYVDKIWGWKDEDQKARLKQDLNEHLLHKKVILINNKPIGVYAVHTTEEEDLFINEISILKEYQHNGIGRKILEEQLKENHKKGIRTILQVFKDNPAKKLYEELGFTTYGETETHYQMENISNKSNIMDLKQKIENYKPYNEQEEKDKEVMLKYINTFDDVLTRNNEFGHFTASSWAVNKQRTKVLMIYHNIYKSWAWTGGHADGESDLLNTAIRELKEETGVTNVKVVDNDIFSLEIVRVDGHIKRGKYVSSHVHLNLAYLLEVDENEELQIKQDENSGVKWVNIEDVEKVSNEDWLIENVYKKLNEKLKNKKEQ